MSRNKAYIFRLPWSYTKTLTKLSNYMILHRFCSNEEYEKYMAGETLVNNTRHSDRFSSTSVGFCFFPEDPRKARHWLSGNVDFDWCLTFAVPDGMVEPSRAKYADWSSPEGGSAYKTEYCCQRYDKSHFKLIKATDEFRTYAPNRRLLEKICPQIFHPKTK